MCRNFYDFLRIACTGDIYDEDNKTFQSEEDLKNREVEQPEDIHVLRERAIENLMTTQGMTRDEAIRNLADLVGISVEEFI